MSTNSFLCRDCIANLSKFSFSLVVMLSDIVGIVIVSMCAPRTMDVLEQLPFSLETSAETSQKIHKFKLCFKKGRYQMLVMNAMCSDLNLLFCKKPGRCNTNGEVRWL